MPYEWSEVGRIGPEMILVAVASTTPLMWVFSKRDNRWAYLALTLVGAVFAAGILVSQWPQESESILSGQLVVDQFSVFLRLVLLAVAAAAVVLGLGNLPRVRFGAYAAILLFSTTGMMLLVGANDLIVMFVSLELMSIPIYALVAITRWRQRSTEGAIKYFTMGALSTAVTAYGVGWLYGVTGETSFAAIGEVFAQREIGPPEFLAIGLIIAALSFKIALVPFHAWTPDAYDGAPTAVTAFISVAPKIAALGLIAASARSFIRALRGRSRNPAGRVGGGHDHRRKRRSRRANECEADACLLEHRPFGLHARGTGCHPITGRRRTHVRRHAYLALLRGCLRPHEYRRICSRDACRTVPLGSRPGGLPGLGSEFSRARSGNGGIHALPDWCAADSRDSLENS